MTEWSVKHRSILALLCAVLCIAGIFAFCTVEQQENPAISSPMATITTIYPGASPENVEKQIIKPFEDELQSIYEIKTLKSYALDSVGIVKVTLKDMPDSEQDDVWDDVKDAMDTVAPDLPETAEEPVFNSDFASAYGLIVGLSSEEYNSETIRKAADELKDLLAEDDGVKAVDVEGAVEQQIEIDLDLVKLQQYGIAPNTVGTLIAARNVSIPGGNLTLNGMKIPVEISGEYRTIDKLARTIVSASETGTPVYLSDVATIRKTDQEMDELVRIGGKPGVLIGVKYADGIKVPDVQKRLMAVLEDYRANGLYADMQMDLIYDQAVYINDSVRLFTTNLIEAVLLLLVVVLLTMGVKSAVIVSLPIPLVSFAVFVYMLLTGIPLHQVSIASLIICLSLMVANGIVSNDNIHVYQERGEDIFTACTAGVREVRIPILTSTLTTIASFLPFLMMNGSAGKFVRSLPILVSVALVVSYITSLTVVPALGFTLLRPSARTRPPRKKRLAACKHWLARKLHLGGIGAQFSGGYEVLLRLVLRGPKRFICLLLALFAGTLCLVPSMKIQLFPPIEREQYVLNVTAQDGAAVEKTAEIAGQVADVLAEQPSISQFSCTVGKSYMKYYVTFFPNDQASNKAQFLIDGSRAQAASVERAVQQAVPGIQTAVRYLEINLPSQWPIQVRIAGKDTDTLRALAEQAAERLRTVEGVQGTENNYGLPTYKLEADVKEETASLVGLTNYEIASTVRMAVNGTEISEFRQEDMEEDALPIVAKVADEDKTAREMLDSIFLTSSVTGSNIPLTQVADIRTDSSLGKILRRNSDRTITVGLYVADGYNTNEVLASVQAALEDFSLPAGYELTYGGENENSQEAFSSLVTPMILAIVLIYLILVFQFGDLAQPFLIMGTIPLSFIGVLLGLKGMGYPIGFMALLGAISLMGVVVNNGIVLLDYIGLQLPQFDDPFEAIVDACKTRLRPIMIGMITTVISLLPLMLSGGDLWAPLAASVVYGMLFSSVLTMLFIPAAFLLLHRSRQKRRPLPHV